MKLTESTTEESQEQKDSEKKPRSFVGTVIAFFSNLMNLKLGVFLIILFYAIIYYQLKHQKCVFEYTQIPEDIKKGGISEEYVVNQINDIMSRISNHEGDLRKISFGNGNVGSGEKKEAGDPNKQSTISGHEYISINNLNLQGIPFKTIVFITDRVLSLFGVNKDNYVSLEFYSKEEQLSLSIQFDGQRENFSTPLNKLNPDHAILSLCYEAAVFLVGKTDPIHLVEYNFDLGNFEESVNACITTIQRNQTDEQKSRAYFIWAMSSYNPRLTDDFLAKLEKAVALDSDNYPAKLFLSSVDINKDVSVHKAEIKKLIEIRPGEAILWYNLIDAIDNRLKPDSAYIEKIYPEVKELDEALKRHDGDVPSEVLWSFGKRLETWGGVNKVFFDSAIVLYNKALEFEIGKRELSFRKISEYYNALAFAYQQKAMAQLGVRLDTCIAELNSDKQFVANLLNSYQYAHQAVAADSLNPWAWSTLGEFYGLMQRVKPTDQNLTLAFQSLQKAFQYGLHIEQYKDKYEPYCYLYKTQRARFDELLKTPLYYDGPLGRLRALRVIGLK